MMENNDTPKLRFPDFNAPWQRSTIENSKLTIIDGDRGINYPNGNDFHPAGYCLFLNAKNVTKTGFNFSDTTFITKSKDEQLRKGKLNRNDIIITTRGTVGNIAFFDEAVPFEQLRINSGMVIIRNENFEISQSYIYILLSSPEKRKRLVEISFGSAQPQLTVSQINKLRIEYPNLPEQQKIANFLTAVETKIQQLNRKKKLLANYKKGIIQQIFNLEIRFKDDDGNSFPKWQKKKLGDFDFISSNSFSRNALNYEIGKIKNIHYGDIHTKLKANFNLVEENIPFINPDIDLSKIANNNFLKEGDLVMADASEDYNDLGKSIEIVYLNAQKVLAGLHTVVLRDSTGLTAIGFKGYLMQSAGIKSQLKKMATGSSVLGITKPNIARVKFYLPSIIEQKKIVLFLTSLDVKIDFINQQLQQAQTFKKGLLQKMFL